MRVSLGRHEGRGVLLVTGHLIHSSKLLLSGHWQITVIKVVFLTNLRESFEKSFVSLFHSEIFILMPHRVHLKFRLLLMLWFKRLALLMKLGFYRVLSGGLALKTLDQFHDFGNWCVDHLRLGILRCLVHLICTKYIRNIWSYNFRLFRNVLFCYLVKISLGCFLLLFHVSVQSKFNPRYLQRAQFFLKQVF